MLSSAILAAVCFNFCCTGFSCNHQPSQVISQSVLETKSNQSNIDRNNQQNIDRKLNFVQNRLIKFATFRVNDPNHQLLRQIVVVRPRELVELSQSNQLVVLDKLVKLLADPDRAYAADVMLVAMTGSPQDTDIVARYYDDPKLWWQLIGRSTHARWGKWLSENRDNLVWNAEKKSFDLKANAK